MMNKPMLLVMAVVILAACSGNPKMDASTEETTRASIVKLRDALPETERPLFDEAVQTLISGAQRPKESTAAPVEITGEARLRLDGKTARQMIAEATRVKDERERNEREAAKREMDILEAGYKACTYGAEQLGRIKILSRNFYIIKNAMQEKTPVIELRVKNETPYQIYRAYFECSLTGPGTGDASKRMKFHHDIYNGLQPGAEAKWHLSPDSFTDWGSMKIPQKPVVDISIVRIDGPDGNALFAAQEFSEQKIMRLAELKKKYGVH